MSVASYGGIVSKAEANLVYTSPSIVISSMGQVVEAVDVDYNDQGDPALLVLANQLLVNVEALEVLTQPVIAEKNTYNENYQEALALKVSVEDQYNTLLSQYNAAVIAFGTPATRTIVDTIGYINGTLTTTNLGNSSIGQYGDTSQGFTNPVILGTKTLEAGMYSAYVNLSVAGITETPTGERLAQNTLAFSVVEKDTYLVVDGANLNSSNFCEYNITNTDADQGVLISIAGVTTFTLTQATTIEYRVMVMRDQNYLQNTPNYIAPATYTRADYGTGTTTFNLNQRAIVIVKMN